MSERIGAEPAAERAAALLARLAELSVDLREAAVIDAGGSQLAATDDRDWSAAARSLWRAVEDGDDPAQQVHVAVEEGELFAVRHAAGSVLTTTERFALASLMLCDLRAVLRDLDAGGS